IKLLLSYTVGKPGPSVDPDTLDQQEWQMHQQAAVPPKQVDDLLTAMPAATANTVAQIGWPCAANQLLAPLVAGLRAADAVPPASHTGALSPPSPAREDQDAHSPA